MTGLLSQSCSRWNTSLSATLQPLANLGSRVSAAGLPRSCISMSVLPLITTWADDWYSFWTFLRPLFICTRKAFLIKKLNFWNLCFKCVFLVLTYILNIYAYCQCYYKGIISLKDETWPSWVCKRMGRTFSFHIGRYRTVCSVAVLCQRKSHLHWYTLKNPLIKIPLELDRNKDIY